ncbi:hypothetical protein Ctob_011855 [Chrysochromulina tobinii]|uniref:Uncharacterized protein n=1 Tax=Chrysochromulina tobinii TaxID=1460289 RepID=A0A0M0KB87_9EUKA|nr:hypothetical protein Ctob_011855 [Chrysochromulina tobinii]|eukprot:KOO35683.1 hypothetical protein Ctob_011855 [Chrysochromulina sp. CCMP291]
MSLRLLLALGCLLPAASFRASGTVGSASTAQRARPAVCGVANVPKTVGEARTGFNKAYGRPVDGVQQGFVNEMLTGCQLALISPGYAPSRVFSLGFESLCTAFLANSGEGPKIHDALLAGLGMDAKKLVSEAEALKAAAAGMSEAELLASPDLKAIASKPGYKYSYPLGAGLLALMALVGSEPSKEVIERWCTALGLPASRLTKDWEFYEDASRKLVEVRQMMAEMKAAGKRKEAAKLKEEAEKAMKEADEAEAKEKAANK